MRPLVRIAVLAVALMAALLPTATPAAAPQREYAVSLDPADYLSTVRDASVLSKNLVAKLAANGVNTIYLNAYNVEYGAYYRTSYRYNSESDYGRQDLLGKLLTAAHARGIEVFASFYDHQHRGAWEAQPGWREQTATGGYYNPPGTDVQYYLSPGNPQAAAWWRGLLRDLLHRYPDLDGVEFREPIVNWWGTSADYNPATTKAFEAAHPGAPLGGVTWRRFRQETLTRFLKAEIALVHETGLTAHVTSVASTQGDGRLLSLAAEAREVGFDLDGLLAGAVRPDAVKVELIWQQWARLYGRVVFTPDWTRTSLLSFLRMVGGRTRVVVHVELTDFGRSTMSVGEFYRTLVAADLPQAAGVDFYSAFLADRKHAWPAVKAVFGHRRPLPLPESASHDRRVLVLYDGGSGRVGDRLALAKIEQAELLNLLGHFDVKWETYPVERYRRGGLTGYDAVFYQGSVYGNAPQAFLSDVSVFGGTIVWIGQNLFQLRQNGVRLPFEQPTQNLVTSDRGLRYRGVLLPARGETIPTRAALGAAVLASVATRTRSSPFILRAGSFWYVSGSPFSFPVLAGGTSNGRLLAFADLLHDMLGGPQRSVPLQAFLRIRDVNPLTPAAKLEADADALAAEHVPFLVSVTPFYVDPSRHLRVSLSQRPAVVEALRYAVAHGGAIVLNGSTYQYRGTTGLDAEFWDLKNGGGVVEDGDAYVRDRIERALRELWRNGLQPLAWETPESLATPYDYSLFGSYFSTFVERRVYGTWRGSAYQQAFPYTVSSDVYGGRVIPANLGYGVTGKRSANAVIVNARRLSVVRDATAVGDVHFATKPSVLSGIAESLRRLGYAFPDLYSAANVVQTAARIDLTGAGRVSLAVPSGWFLQERVFDRTGRLVRASLTRFPHYGRPSRSFAGAPHGGLVSLQVLTPAQAAALRGSPAGAVSPAPRGWSSERLLVYGLLGLGLAGVALLLGAYVVVRVRRNGGSA
jgi:hypothetical protein